MVPVAFAGGSHEGPDDPISQAQTLLLRLGEMRFGPPMPGIQERIRAVVVLHRLEALITRALKVASWEELLSKGS